MEQKKLKSVSDSMRLRFGIDRKLKKNVEFTRVFSAGCSTSDSRLVVYACDNKGRPARVGMAVGKRLGSAVRRNRYKRTLREAFRLIQHEIPAEYDYVLIPRQKDKISTQLYRKSLLELCRRLHNRSSGKKQE